MSVMSVIQNKVTDSVIADLYESTVELLVDDYFGWTEAQAEAERIHDEVFADGEEPSDKAWTMVRQYEERASYKEDIYLEKMCLAANQFNREMNEVRSDVEKAVFAYQN